MTQARGDWRRVFTLAAWGGLAFWLANFAISLTPIAAEYRTALSISYVPMLVQALLGGLAVGLGVAYGLVHLDEKIPPKSPVLKSVLLGVIALMAVTLFVEVPAKFLAPTTNSPIRFFLIATAFNVVRIIALGVVIGYLYRRPNSLPRR